MLRGRAAVAAALLLTVLAACGTDSSGGGQSGAPLGDRPSSKVDVATKDMVAAKKASKVEDCRAGSASDGGLPAVELPCLGGGDSVDLASFEGPMVVNLFQGFCAPCKEEMPALQSFYETYGDEVPVIGIDVMDTVPGVALEEAISRGVTFPMYADPGGELQGGPLTARAVPATYVLSETGEVELLQMGGMTSAGQVKRLVEKKLGITL
ncbi:thiol-disulfide isomerase/thioredoxin [Nocardioides luteus]|uniref:Thiol-disulfide isomerase n=1 Tax=Nocardioides luteus TaxID=1844 RepID=A0ABQ5SR60_9ACTN|nr:TlpA disulfide reductase family protein [Nocardioides luteus]MDR7313349.1 thiol-disulfide isomerase/thioredoxin [Nocardioides luteus]GGR60379.1 thiol-disulfide isomerase [Nocardioides luteus]GLJ66414.1 thiol-disulfide isomerase [Nocardioides luteus]